MKPAKLRDDALLADIQAADPRALTIWWLGQSGFLLGWGGEFALLDPYLSDSLTAKYASTNKPHIRMTECVIAPERLSFVSVVTSSHNHTDHLDAETLGPILGAAREPITVIAARANAAFAAQRLAVPVERIAGIRLAQPIAVGPFTFYAVPAAHNTLDQDENGDPRYIGLVVEAGPHTVYHSGDTLLYPGMVETLRRWRIDVALLPINGNDPARSVAGNLDPAEAAQLAKDIGARVAIPCHYDMFTFNTADPAAFAAACRAVGQNCKILENGANWRTFD